MGNPHSKPEDRLRFISREVNSLRSSLRHSRQNLSKDKKDAIIESLVLQSGEISAMHGKVKQKKIDDAMKIISNTMEEVLKTEPRDSGMTPVESNSFVYMPTNQQRANSVGSITSQKSSTKSLIKTRAKRISSVPRLRELEDKLVELQPQISTALDNKDTKQLRVYKSTLKVLADDLEMIHVEKGTPLEQQKKNFMQKLTSIYQKITKAVKETKRDDNLQYLSKQSQKEKALKDLADIELHLAENESLLDKMYKEKNVSNAGVIRNNVIKIDQKLNAVDIVDKEIKEKVVVLTQKFTETVKKLDRTMAKKEFDSKFAKALENYERTIKNINQTSDLEVAKNTLENIRNSVENLEEINDTTKNRKRDLFANINKQIKNIEDDLKQEADREAIQHLVEDNVVLRKKNKSTDREHTVIDQFINYWTNVKSNFNVNSYSKLSLLRTDHALEEMQQSINEIRIEIANKCDTNPPTNLIRKYSQSLPRLNAKKSYGSNRSLDQLENKIIKTKAKMYNISTPELLSVQKEPQNNIVNKRFSKIEEIKMNVHYIKEKITESQNRKLLQEKLEHYLQNLSQYEKDSNKAVSSNALIVSNDIIELLHSLALFDFKDSVDLLTKKVQNFSGTKYDKEYEELKDDLDKIQGFMENFIIPGQYKELLRKKDSLLEEIYYNIGSIEEKTSPYKKRDADNLKKINAKLQTLNDKVRTFSGTYKGVLYNQIERELNKLLLDIGEQVEEKLFTDEITKHVEKLLKILEQRASLAQSFRTSKTETVKNEDQIGIAKIKNDLFNIKKEIDSTPDNNIDAFIGLQSRLDLVNIELDQILTRSSENLEKEKAILSNEAQTLRNVVDAKVVLSKQPLVQWPDKELQQDLRTYPKNDVNKEMEKLESKFQAIKNEINTPTTEEDIHKHYKLAQDIKKLSEKLNQYNFIRGTDLDTRKTSLLNEMMYYIESLEKEAKDVDYVMSIEKKLNTFENILNNSQQSNLISMAKELQAIQTKLETHKFNDTNETLRERRTSVQQKTDDLALKVKRMSDNEAEIRNKQLNEDIKKIKDIEEKVKILRPDVTSFVGLQSDSKFYELDETTMRLILILDKFDTENSELQKRKIKLLKELQQFGQILDDRAQQTQEVYDIEQNLEKASLLINEFSGEEEELFRLKAMLESLGNKIQTLRVNKELIYRKNENMQKFSLMFNRIMTLNIAPPPSHANSIQQNTHQVRMTESTNNSVSSSRQHTVAETVSSDYNSQNVNFANTKSNSVQKAVDIVKLEKEIKRMEFLIHNTDDKNKLQEIDDACTYFTTLLENLNYPKDSAEYKIKIELLQILNNIADEFDRRNSNNTNHEIMAKIQQEVDEIGNKLATPLPNEHIDQLDERLIQLQVILGKLNIPELKSQIDACMLNIILHGKRIADYKQSAKSTSV